MARTRGRPPIGRGNDRKITVYIASSDVAALDRLADLRTVQAKNTSRTELIREAVKKLLKAEGFGDRSA
jgi:uncharacterized protein (UPF0297 family)